MKSIRFSAQDEVDLGNDLSLTLEFDDGPESAAGRQKLLKSSVTMGYATVTEHDGHIVHVINTPELKRLGLTLTKIDQ